VLRVFREMLRRYETLYLSGSAGGAGSKEAK
jgi:hypothetical protein